MKSILLFSFPLLCAAYPICSQAGDCRTGNLPGKQSFMRIIFQLQVKPTFSPQEMQRRLDMIRHHMETNGIDACVFTSYHNIHYYSDFLYCYFGRPYAFIVTDSKTISVSAGRSVEFNLGIVSCKCDGFYLSIAGARVAGSVPFDQNWEGPHLLAAIVNRNGYSAVCVYVAPNAVSGTNDFRS